MEKVIDFLAKRYKDFEICRETREMQSIEEGAPGLKCDTIGKMEWAVRVFENGKSGFSYISGRDVDTASLEQNLRFSIDNSFADEDNILPDVKYASGTFYNKDAVISKDSGLKDIVGGMKERASQKKLVSKVERASASSEEKTVEFYNSRAGFQSQKIIKYAAGIVIVVEKDGEEKIEWDFAIEDEIKRIDAGAIADKAYERGVKLLNSSPANTGVYPIFLENRAACDFLEVFAQSFIGENVYKKKTILHDGITFSEKLNVFDDPGASGGSMSYEFDGEGLSASKKCLVEKGAVKNLLFDCFYGRKMNKKSTGNSVRAKIIAPPANWYSNVWIAAGEKGAVTRALQKSGVVAGIVSIIGMHLVNPATGELSVGFEGYILENGIYKKALSQVSISGNLKDLFKNIIEVGDDPAFYGQTGSPSLLVRDVVVSGV